MPNGLASSSGVVGRYYMNHNCTAILAIDPRRINDTRFPKTLSINDFYFACEHDKWPLGNIQMLGKLRAPMLRGAIPHMPRRALQYRSDQSVDLYAIDASFFPSSAALNPALTIAAQALRVGEALCRSPGISAQKKSTVAEPDGSGSASSII